MKLVPFRHFLSQASFKAHHLVVSGGDALEFLQGQSTQKVSATWSFHSFLERSGKVESSFLLWSEDTVAHLLVSSQQLPQVLQRFEKYVISEDVEVANLGVEEWWCAMGGPTQEGLQSQLNGETASLSPTEFKSAQKMSYAQLIDYLSWQGIPSLDGNSAVGELINQTRLFDVAVDMKKGCFPGQEVVAKIYHNRGAAWSSVLLQRLTSDAVPSQIVLEDKVVAKISEKNNGEYWQAEVLRDVRVEGLEVAGRFKVKLYPLYDASPAARASELFHFGTDAFRDGHETEALEFWTKAIEIDPTYADAYEAMGVLLGRQEKFVEAESWMRKLLEVDSSSVMAHTNLSLFLMRQNRIQEAEDHKAKATVAQFAVFGKKAAQDRAEKEAKEKAEAARLQREKMFQEVLEIDPEDALANYGLGTLAFEREQYQLAQDYLQKVIASDAGYAVAYLALGKALKALSKPDEARRIWNEGVKIAAKKGEMMPANEMQSLLASLG